MTNLVGNFVNIAENIERYPGHERNKIAEVNQTLAIDFLPKC